MGVSDALKPHGAVIQGLEPAGSPFAMHDTAFKYLSVEPLGELRRSIV